MKISLFLSLLLLTACTFAAIPPAPGRQEPTRESDDVYYPPDRYVSQVPDQVLDLRCVDAIFLNIRLGPGVNYPVDGFLSEGDMVKVLESVNGWARIRAGWVRESYLVKCDE